MEKTFLHFVVAFLVVFVQGVAAQDDLKWVDVHGWLMWSSFGFLLPLGVILIRFNRSPSAPTVAPSLARAKYFGYVHYIVQCSGIGLATAGVFTIRSSIGWDFSNTHRRLGWALLILVVIMPFISIIRPTKGKPSRSPWFFVHWLFGTGAVMLGFVNMYIGIAMYQKEIKPIRSLDIAFSIQVAFMGLAYFLQGQWSYILSQGRVPDRTEEQLEDPTFSPKKSPTASSPVTNSPTAMSPTTLETV